MERKHSTSSSTSTDTTGNTKLAPSSNNSASSTQGGKFPRGLPSSTTPSNASKSHTLIPSAGDTSAVGALTQYGIREEVNCNGSTTGSVSSGLGLSVEENNNALPAEYWLNRQPMADQIVITDVTVCDMTVTIRECKTKQGFFKEREHLNNTEGGFNSNSSNIGSSETDKLSNNNKDGSCEKSLATTSVDTSGKSSTGGGRLAYDGDVGHNNVLKVLSL